MDLYNEIEVKNTLVPALRNTGGNGSTVDLQGSFAAMIQAVVGAITDGAHTLTVQESPDGLAWNDVASGDLQGAFVSLVANTVQKVGYLGRDRYLRVNNASSGITGGTFAVSVVKGQHRKVPV